MPASVEKKATRPEKRPGRRKVRRGTVDGARVRVVLEGKETGDGEKK